MWCRRVHTQSGADEALEAYRAAQELAFLHLATTHPIRLVSPESFKMKIQGTQNLPIVRDN